MIEPWRGLALGLTLFVAAACGGNAGPAKPPELPADRYAKCKVKNSQSRPLIVEWPSTDRATLESLAKRGLVAVRYSGCEMELLTRCRAKGSYKYTPVTLQTERVTIRDADELYAALPVGAARLEGQLEKSGELNVDTAIVGTFDADQSSPTRADLEGDCARATHVLTSLTAGAFEFYTGAGSNVGGGVGVFGVGAGAKNHNEQRLLSRSGSEEACKHATASDERPPEGCGALLRVEATPLAIAPETHAPLPSAEPPPEAPPPGPSPSEPPASDAHSNANPAPVDSAPEVDSTSGGPPPAHPELDYAPGVLLGFRGPFGIHFGKLEDGVRLDQLAPVTGGGVLELGYRIVPTVSVAATGTIFAGTPASSSAACPKGLTCRATILGPGADVIVTPNGDESFWFSLGAEATWIFSSRDGSYADAGSDHTVSGNRHYFALGPRACIGRDFVDAYVPQIQYGFMAGYSLRKVVSAGGDNRVDGKAAAVGDGSLGLSHTILLIGRFHFDFGVRAH